MNNFADSITHNPFEHDIARVARLAIDQGRHEALLQCVRWLRWHGHPEAAGELLCASDRILDKEGAPV